MLKLRGSKSRLLCKMFEYYMEFSGFLTLVGHMGIGIVVQQWVHPDFLFFVILVHSFQGILQ
jgi:hypothetical protein